MRSAEEQPMKLSLVVDGKAQSVDADPAMPLLYALRDDLGLNNPKIRLRTGAVRCLHRARSMA
jgi:aerobic-type carbon monoxide dehydrogenase small subunit (CoxS/CutS family)